MTAPYTRSHSLFACCFFPVHSINACSIRAMYLLLLDFIALRVCWHLDFIAIRMQPKKKMTKSRKINKNCQNITSFFDMVKYTHGKLTSHRFVWQPVHNAIQMTNFSLMRYQPISMTLLYLCWCRFFHFFFILSIPFTIFLLLFFFSHSSV